MGLVMAVLAATMIIHGMVFTLCLSSFTTRLRVEGVREGGVGKKTWRTLWTSELHLDWR
jgi:hypothetical protein